MNDVESENKLPTEERLIPILLIAGVVSLILVGTVVAAFVGAKRKTGQIILPGGITYLGPSPSTKQSPTTSYEPRTSSYIPIAETAKWVEQKGRAYPYTFLYPDTLSLGVFPGDPFDSVTIFWEKTDAQKNVFFRVEDLSKIPDQEKYTRGSKKAYAENWWRQYSWKGLSKVETFTNDHNLKGYKATYKGNDGKPAAYNHYFLEVPEKPNLVIWISSSLLSDGIVEKIAQSVSWSD